MPVLEIKSLRRCLSRSNLQALALAVENELKIPKTSKMRVIWHHIPASHCVGMDRDSVVVYLVSRNVYRRKHVLAAMKKISAVLSKTLNIPPAGILVLHFPLLGGQVLSANGLWLGGQRFAK